MLKDGILSVNYREVDGTPFTSQIPVDRDALAITEDALLQFIWNENGERVILTLVR